MIDFFWYDQEIFINETLNQASNALYPSLSDNFYDLKYRRGYNRMEFDMAERYSQYKWLTLKYQTKILRKQFLNGHTEEIKYG
jgi:hypothetical protein